MKLSEIFRKVIARETDAPEAETAPDQTDLTNAPRDEELLEELTVNRVGKRVIELKVSDTAAVRRALPAGYVYPDAAEAARLHAKLLRELPPDHPLFGVPLETFAAREGSDDTLFRYRGNPRLFALVRPAKSGQAEIVFTGSFEQFVEREQTGSITPAG